MPRTFFFLEEIIHFCTNTIILLTSLCKSTPQYTHTYPFPPGSAPVHPVTPPCTIELEFLYHYHLDLSPGHPRGPILTTMKEMHFNPLFWCASCPRLQLANQAMPHTESWRPLATAVNYIVRIVPIVYMAFQARPASPVGVQPDSGMSCDRRGYTSDMVQSGQKTVQIS
ncbi:hypothetical protein DSO57_1031377 [Entomophthora muscae]|uniref:Uncharacterized protein n=1 Tax=Entomophthora muscae TaxID=34485 RepID=A0ACC2SPV2_9FUNG|nr:hypothetical protein DSO57_1031377 [Entomophthora muscae]